MNETPSIRRLLYVTLFIGLVLRLWFVINQGLYDISRSGGDEFWYIANGVGLFASDPSGSFLGYTYQVSTLGVAPLYLVVIGFLEQIWNYPNVVAVLKVFQCFWSVGVCYLAYDLGKILTKDARVGYITALALITSISFIIEPSYILTEMLYISLITLSIWIYCKFIVPDIQAVHWLVPLVVGIFLGLTTLTRAVGLLFPLGIMGHAVLISIGLSWRKGLQVASIVLISYSLTISTWTIYNIVQYDRFIIVSNQFFPTLWRGASEEDGSPSQNDEILGDDTAQQQSVEIISSDPVGFLDLRARELVSSYLQPHGTIVFGGESLKTLASNWVRSGFSWDGFKTLVTGEGFLIKLVIYIWHYVALIAGLIGMWLTRNQWRVSLVMIGFILYTTLIHFALLALPRYIYPTYVFFWIFAAVTLVALWDKMRGTKNGADNRLPQ